MPADPAAAPAAPRLGAAEWTMLIALSILWGGSFFFNGVAVRELPTLTVVFARVGLAAVILLALLILRGDPIPRDRKILSAFLAMGLLNNVAPFALIVWGQSHIASGLAAILNATTPLFTVVVANAFTADERLTGLKLLGVAFGFSGVAVLIGGGAWQGGAFGGWSLLAHLAILGAALSYAFAGVYGRRFRALGLSPTTTAAGQVTASTLVLAPLALTIDRPWTLPAPSLAAWGALIGLAAFATALAYILYFRILARAGAVNLLLVTFLVPVSAILLGVTFLGETLAPRHFAGMALIGLGLAAVDGRLFHAVAGARVRP